MTNKFLEEQKSKLEKNKNELEKELSSFAEQDPKIKDNWRTKFTDFGDRTSDLSEEIDQTEEYEADLSVEHTLEIQLKKINDALERIKKNTYGICEKCKGKIKKKRLKANPEAELCIKCATK
jgi:DnaK suppressor protein